MPKAVEKEHPWWRPWVLGAFILLPWVVHFELTAVTAPSRFNSDALRCLIYEVSQGRNATFIAHEQLAAKAGTSIVIPEQYVPTNAPPELKRFCDNFIAQAATSTTGGP